MLCHDIGMASFSFIMGIGENMNTEVIIEQIDAEISKLQQAKALLTGATSPAKRALGRPKASNEVSKPVVSTTTKRVMSAEGKAKIAEAQKRRWAKSKRADKKAAKKAATAKPVKSATPAQS
jgi:hypothetical protein